MRNRMAMGALALFIVAAPGVWLARNFPAGAPHGPDQQRPGRQAPLVSLVTMIDMASAPADVQKAAELLKTSRVGYAMVKPDRTYLIIATGEQGPQVKIDRAEAQPAGGDATLVKVFLKTAADGHRLMIATVANTAKVDYQFNLDGLFAGIPSLVNHHNLPLSYLDEAHGFSVITPAQEQVVTGATLHVSGFARVFEGAFMVKVVTADGREVGTAAVKAKAGAPDWGCFNADVAITTANVTETGSVLFEGDGQARLTLPVRFKPPA